MLLLVLSTVAQLAHAQLANSCWPKFRADTQNTGQGIYGGTGSDLTWTFPAGGAIRSSPAVGVDGTVYFACDDGYLYAVAGSGALLWTFNCNCAGSSSPAIAADGTIYIGSGSNYLYAINSNGTLKWKKSLTVRIDSSVTVGYDGTIYFGCINGTFYAVRSNNSTRWTYAAGGSITSSPAIAPDTSICFGCQDGSVYALYTTGALKWKFTPPGSGSFVASPAVGPDGTVYIGSRGGFFYAVRVNGTQKWRTNAGGEVWSSAAIDANGNIYYGCRDGKLHALSNIGGPRWTFTTGHYVDSSPAVGVDGGVYVGSVDGKLYSLNPDGTQRWNYDTGAAIYSSPAIGPAGALFLGADNGTLPDATDILGWTDAGTSTDHTITGLDLVSGLDYYINVRATNGAGLMSLVGSSDGIYVESTPPTIPVVTVPNNVLPADEPLGASWIAEDPDTMVAEYTYAVGTEPGTADVAGWVSAGIETAMSRDDLILQVGQTYYVSVKARNPSQRWSEIGVSEGVTIVPPDGWSTLGGVKVLTDGTGAFVQSKVVNAVFDDCFFVEEANRSSGIRCVESGVELEVGELVDVQGTVATLNGEKVLSPASHAYVCEGDPVAPLGFTARQVALAAPDPFGLRVRLWGKVTEVGADYFIIDDGMGIEHPGGGLGIEVRGDPGSVAVDDYVGVDGILCRELVNDQPTTVLRMTPADTVTQLN